MNDTGRSRDCAYHSIHSHPSEPNRITPNQLAVKNVFIRGSVVRYIQIPASEVDVQLLQDSCRKDSQSGKGR
jgi:predicted nucleotidyltransferase